MWPRDSEVSAVMPDRRGGVRVDGNCPFSDSVSSFK